MAADLIQAFHQYFVSTRFPLSTASTHSDDSQQLIRLLSEERLEPFLALTGTYPAAIDLHLDTLRLGGTLMTVTGMIEIALRNSICELMEQHFGHPDWLTAPTATFDFLVSEFGESNDAGKRYLACLVDRDIRRLRDDARILQATIAGFRK